MVVKPAPASSGTAAHPVLAHDGNHRFEVRREACEAVEADVMPEHITGKGDQEGEEVQSERLVRVQRRTRGLWIFGDQLEVEQAVIVATMKRSERQPDHAADLIGDVAGDGIDARPQDVTDDEEQQQLGAHHPSQLRL